MAMKKSSGTTTTSSSTSSETDQPRSFADQQWTRAAEMLSSNPSLVTYHILCMALKHRPPPAIIEFMLRLNPSAASIPKEGPSPLQVAVEHSCSLTIIRQLIEACPLSLVATNPGSHLDPLSYAKRFRPDESELIQLLSLPLSHWITDDADANASDVEDSDSSDEEEEEEEEEAVERMSKVGGQVVQHTDKRDDDEKTEAIANTQPSPPKHHFRTTSKGLFFDFKRHKSTPTPAPPSAVARGAKLTPPSRLQSMTRKLPAPAPRATFSGFSCVGEAPLSSTKDTSTPRGDSTPSEHYPGTAHAMQQQETADQTTLAPSASSSLQLASMDRQELINVKQLCLAVVKGHRRLYKEIKALQEGSHTDVILRKLQSDKDKMFRTQLIALDMKEQAMRSHLTAVEAELMSKFKESIKDLPILQDQFGQLSRMFEDRMQQMQHCVVVLEEKVEEKMDSFERRMHRASGHDASWTPSWHKALDDAAPHTISTDSSGSNKTSSSSISSTTAKTTATAVQDPIVYCSPPNVYINDMDEVRSLLSEDDVMARKKKERQHHGWLIRHSQPPAEPRWLILLKEMGRFL